MEERFTGLIARLVRDRGFGFIRRHSDGHEYFFHRSMLTGGARFDQLREGLSVTFAVEPNSPKGPRATNVEVETKPVVG